MARRYFSSTFTATTLTSGIGAGDTTFTVASVAGAPASLPWTGVISRGTSSEELVEVTGVSGTTLTVTRALDGTTAKAQSVGAAFEHVASARDFDEANAFINGGASAAYVARAEATTAAIAAAEGTSSSTYTDLATAGPVVTVTTGTRALVIVGGSLLNDTAGGFAFMAFAISGATTRAPADVQALIVRAATVNQEIAASRVFLVTDLTPGVNTFTAKYRAAVAPVARMAFRDLTVIPF